ncbi:hypothetical protein DPV79_16035 [Burkholderia reimsis]|uniref:Uncharacterized protein n=1 Tax=Burkholderia reimsis TaxID=2234132 RepID=A0A365QWM5_9BURK|nr:hypothetical protein [Burkholderia reimsis]RBB38889.1 hypothetical protein DPV79_16035 [Burkholderia reimsis]
MKDEANEVEHELALIRAIENAHILAHAAHIIDQHIDRCATVLCERMGTDDVESARMAAGTAALALVYFAEEFLREAKLTERHKR